MDAFADVRGVPPGISFLRKVRTKDLSFGFYQSSVLLITFLAYLTYHASRKPLSIVKSVLASEILDSNLTANEIHLHLPHVRQFFHKPVVFHVISLKSSEKFSDQHGPASSIHRQNSSTHQGLQSGWAPFSGKFGKSRLGEVDVVFLGSYALGMFFAGHLGDRVDLRLFLTMGMILSGIFVCLFGLGFWLTIHSFSYYIMVQMLGGFVQATGWPAVVAVVANWFDRSKRGVIMGLWNSHTSLGNIVGSLLAATVLPYGWGWSFLLPGLAIIAGASVVFLFLVTEPANINARVSVSDDGIRSIEMAKASLNHMETPVGVGLSLGTRNKVMEKSMSNLEAMDGMLVTGAEENRLLLDNEAVIEAKVEAIGFLKAWTIPGVYQFSVCLFFSKLVAYTFLYWLPFYIRHNKISNNYLSNEAAGNLSTIFDVGGVIGGILAGLLSDKLNARALIASIFIYCSIPALILYHFYGSVSFYASIWLMMLLGVFVNGPYALITTAVSADLGTHCSLKGNRRALATVTAIIDGTGSIGAAIGPMLTGYISQHGWTAVFMMLMVAALFAGLSLSSLVYDEILKSMFRVSEVNEASQNS